MLMNQVIPCEDHPHADKDVERSKEYKIQDGRVTGQVEAYVYTVRCSECGRTLSEERREVSG